MIRKTILWAEGAAVYVFQGGEPTLWGTDLFKKAIAYETQYNRYHVQARNALQTNGYLLDDERCHFLKENHFLVGLFLDRTGEINDIYRHASGRKPVLDWIFQAVKLLEEHGMDFNIPTVMTNSTAARIREIYGFYWKQNWDYRQYIARLDPLDEEYGGNSYAFSPEQYKDLLIISLYLWYEDWEKGCQPHIRQFESYIGILMGYHPEACNQRGVYDTQNAVETDGNACPCDFYVLDEYRLGNFNTGQLGNIDRRRQEIGFAERFKELKDSYPSCSYYNICRGGYQRNQDLGPESGLYDDHFCESYRMFFDACPPLMEEIMKKQSAGQ